MLAFFLLFRKHIEISLSLQTTCGCIAVLTIVFLLIVKIYGDIQDLKQKRNTE